VKITAPGYASDTGTQTMSGTSMAAPHVAGAAALVLGADPAATPAQVLAALTAKASASKVTSPGTGSVNKLLNTSWLNTPAVTPTTAPTTTVPVVACGPFLMGTDVKIGKLGTASSSVTISGCTGTASATSWVTVTVAHAYRGSLVVTLVSPQGTKYPLKQADKGDKTANLEQKYTINLSGTSRNGTWTLQVKDTYGTTTGVLDNWRLAL
jgi:subtilisin family serine protease